jgi:two-component system, cell cycle response regulator
MTKSEAEMPARILVVDDEPMNLELMEAMLTPAGYEVSMAGGGEEGLAAALRDKPDLILLDLMMPVLSGFEVCARLKSTPETQDIPILFVTALTTPGNRERALAAGGDDFIAKPVQRPELLARVEGLLKVRYLNRDLDRALASLHKRALERLSRSVQERAAFPAGSGEGTILVVDDEPLTRRLYSDVLQEAGYTCYTAESGAQALEITRQQAVDVVLLDIMMPARSGLEVLADLGEQIPDSPVIIVTAHPSSDNAIAALRLGAFDFIVKGFKSEVMLATVSRALARRRSAVRSRQMIRQLEAKIQDLLALVRGYAEESDTSARFPPKG